MRLPLQVPGPANHKRWSTVARKIVGLLAGYAMPRASRPHASLSLHRPISPSLRGARNSLVDDISSCAPIHILPSSLLLASCATPPQTLRSDRLAVFHRAPLALRLPGESFASLYDVSSDGDAQSAQQDETWLLAVQTETNQSRCFTLVIENLVPFIKYGLIQMVCLAERLPIDAAWSYRGLGA